jgi:hypothetical protein
MPYLFGQERPPEACVSESQGIVKKIVNLGEERIAEVVDELLSNDKVSSVVAKAMTRTQGFKSILDKNVSLAFSLLNQPTREDFDKIRKHVRNLDRQIEDLNEKLDALSKTVIAGRKKSAKSEE